MDGTSIRMAYGATCTSGDIMKKYEQVEEIPVKIWAWITPRREFTCFHFTELDPYKRFRAAVRTSNGTLHWQWCKTRKEAVEWIETWIPKKE